MIVAASNFNITTNRLSLDEIRLPIVAYSH